MWIRILLAMPVAIVCGYVGLRRLLHASVAGVGIILSISAVRSMYEATDQYFRSFINGSAAAAISFVLLAVVPAVLTIYLGRKALVRLAIVENMDPIVDAIAGAFFGAGMFIAIGYLIVGGNHEEAKEIIDLPNWKQ